MPTFDVTAQVRFVTGSYMQIDFEIEAATAADVTRQVTPDYILANISDDWGPPIESVIVVKAQPRM